MRKAKVGFGSTPTQTTIHSDGERFLLKKMDEKYGDKAWLFENLGASENKYLEKVALRITQYENEHSGKKIWIESGKDIPENYSKTNVSLFKRKKMQGNKVHYLNKTASELQPQQESALKQLDANGGVLLHHSTGSGKTRTFLEAVARAQAKDPMGRSIIVAPASLVSNVDKEILKHKLNINKGNLDVYSYEKATRMADELSKNKYILAIADEAHRLRNVDTERTKRIGEILSNADTRILATATANYNHLADIAPLMNITSAEGLMPTGRKEVENRYLDKFKTNPTFFRKIMGDKPVVGERLKNTAELQDLFSKYVHYYDSSENPEVLQKFPSKNEHVVPVDMSSKQLKMYRFVEGDMPALLRMKIRRNMPLSKKEMANLNAFSTGVRQVSTGYKYLDKERGGDYTPKIKQAVASLKSKLESSPSFKGLIYSNFLDSGVHEYSRCLTDNGIAHQVYTGGLNPKEKDIMVQNYNSGKAPVLLVSSSGAEGLDLKGTRLIQIMDPHFNPSKIRQIVGRGVRYESHEHLPEDERNVEVEHYLSVHPEPMIGKRPTSIEKYLYENSGDKQTVFDQVKELMKNP